ncbi:hypothetical protein GCM10009647_021680 [Streptomyces sanglieri]
MVEPMKAPNPARFAALVRSRALAVDALMVAPVNVIDRTDGRDKMAGDEMAGDEKGRRPRRPRPRGTAWG